MKHNASPLSCLDNIVGETGGLGGGEWEPLARPYPYFSLSPPPPFKKKAVQTTAG